MVSSKSWSMSVFNWLSKLCARALIYPEDTCLISPTQWGCFCLACNLRRSGFSVIVNRTRRTVASETLELKCLTTNALKDANVMFGKGCVMILPHAVYFFSFLFFFLYYYFHDWYMLPQHSFITCYFFFISADPMQPSLFDSHLTHAHSHTAWYISQY